jgi:hypothetical protein
MLLPHAKDGRGARARNAVSTVTVLLGRVLRCFQPTRGLPNTAQIIRDIAFVGWIVS